MKRTLAAVAAILSCASLAPAEESAAGTPVALLAHERVRKELKLTDDQAKTVKGLAADVKKGEVKPADALGKAKKALKEDQLNRLKQISYQVRGGAALADEDLATELKLTKKQAQQVKDVWADEEKKLKDFLAVARFRSEEAMRAHIADHRKKAAQRMLEVLTAGQKKEFTKLQGKAFETSGLDRE